MLRALIAVALIQYNLGKPLEDGALIPHDVEIIPEEEHGHHTITSSLEKISVEDNEIPLNDYEGEIDDDDNIRRPDRDTALCSAEEKTGGRANCKDKSSEANVKQETNKLIEKTEPRNLETTNKKHTANKDQEINESVDTTEQKNFETTNNKHRTNKDQKTNEIVDTTDQKNTETTKNKDRTNNDKETNESVETVEGKDTDDAVETNEGKETNESLDTNESVETNEVVLLNQTIRMNSSAIHDGKLTIVLHFEVQDDHTVEVVSSEIVNPGEVSNDDGGDVQFCGPVHAQGKVCVGAHYRCDDDHTVKVNSNEIIHSGDVPDDSNETVDVEDADEDDIINFSGPVHAQGNVCLGAHYGCGGLPISKCFSRLCPHDQHFYHPTSGNNHDIQEDEDYSVQCRCHCPNIACQYYSTLDCGHCRNPEYHVDFHDHHFDCHHNHHHHQHHFDHHQDHFDHQDHNFDHNEDKDYSHEHQYEDYEKYFTRDLDNSHYDSDSGEDDILRWFPVSGYVPVSGSVKIAAQY